jgi:hypothetical protein
LNRILERGFATMTSSTKGFSLSLLLLLSAPSRAKLEHQILFPPNDEYDHKILDPNTIYGSPYGGFARATRSRLAKLPLVLPVASSETEYLTVTDGEGRRFVCRTYSEDLIDKKSMNDSLFDRVVYKPPDPEEKKDDDAVVTPPQITELSDFDRIRIARENILSAMQSLNGVCTQLHQGWWSYEWCAEKHIRQFHIEMDGPDSQLKMQSISSLGSFRSRNVEVAEQVVERRARQKAQRLPSESEQEPEPDYDDLIDQVMEPLLGGQKEVGRVIDRYESGVYCDTIRKPRTTKVEYRCCSPDQMQKLKPFIIYKGTPIASDIAAIAKLDEPSTCQYHALICTPILCEGLAELYKQGPVVDNNTNKKTAKKNTPPAKSKTKKDNESIREIIDRTLDGICLLSSHANHYWIYELCHGEHARQFHEVQVVDLVTGLTNRETEVEYLLGNYDEEALESFDRKDEIKYVVNVTELDKPTLARTQANSVNRANGAYFYQEYTGGQICDGNDPDVKDKGGVPRSVTVRYFCGPDYQLSNVNEDETCHYIMDITLPDLCEHPLFMKPLDKKQIIKCLPIKE